MTNDEWPHGWWILPMAAIGAYLIVWALLAVLS